MRSSALCSDPDLGRVIRTGYRVMQYDQHVKDWIAHAPLLQVAGYIIALDEKALRSPSMIAHRIEFGVQYMRWFNQR